jgi:serine phosphatase RsbU (regulator of sigma subunit)
MSRVLHQIPLFASFSTQEIDYLLAGLKQVEISSGSILFREGDHGDCFYIVIDGRLEVIKAMGSPDERLLNILNVGDSFGEMCLLDPDGLRTASIRAKTNVRLWEICREDFNGLISQRPEMAFEIARALSQRLGRADNATIRDLQEKNQELSKAYQELKAAQAMIIEQEKLERELQLAREIQKSMLPQTLPCLPGFDFGVRLDPARAVGGDFYDFIPLGPDVLGIAIGDVSGKGVPAAIFMAMTRSLIRAAAEEQISPRQTLAEVNRHLLEMNEAAMFVTVLYGVLNRVTRRFDYVRAGHTLPILCEQGKVNTELASASGQPLGVIPEPILDEQCLTLAPGSLMLVYTDGITEAQNTQGEFFGLDELYAETEKFHANPAQEVCERLMEQVMAFQAGADQYDDAAVVVVRAV